MVNPSAKSKVSRITKRPGLITGDPNDLAEINWSNEWNPDAPSDFVIGIAGDAPASEDRPA